MNSWTIFEAGKHLARIFDDINQNCVYLNENNTPPKKVAIDIVAVIREALNVYKYDDYYLYLSILKNELLNEIEKL